MGYIYYKEFKTSSHSICLFQKTFQVLILVLATLKATSDIPCNGINNSSTKDMTVFSTH